MAQEQEFSGAPELIEEKVVWYVVLTRESFGGEEKIRIYTQQDQAKHYAAALPVKAATLIVDSRDENFPLYVVIDESEFGGAEPKTFAEPLEALSYIDAQDETLELVALQFDSCGEAPSHRIGNKDGPPFFRRIAYNA